MTSRRSPLPAFAAPALLAAVALGGCNSAKPPAPAVAAEAPTEAALPEGSGCSGAIARYRAILDNDLAMGHVNASVYDQVQKELAEAASECSAGRDAKATSLVRASKARHG